MPDMIGAAIAAHRFGLGPRPGELRAIADDPRGWVKAQVRSAEATPAAIAALPACEDDLLAFGRWLAQRRLRDGGAGFRRQAEREGVAMADVDRLSVEEDFVATFRDRVTAAVGARIVAALETDAPVRERLVHFWSNHFTVSSARPTTVALPPSFERDAIRPHVMGRFGHMLQASCQHPGMLVYLDTWLSIGPNSVWGRNPRQAPRVPGAGRPTGLNENLAREILELHTLGVDGGYSQADVQALAAIISGWTYERARIADLVGEAPGTRTGQELFRFVADAHEPGAHALLGQSYGQEGVAQGEAALAALARHPSTGRFIALKLARHFVADEPPAALVERLAARFSRTDGDLLAVFETLVDSDEAWAEPLAKFKRPEEYLIAVMRGLNVRTVQARAAIGALDQMGQRPYSAPGPNGWSDLASAWLNPDLVWKRVEFAQQAAERAARADVSAVQLIDALCGPLASAVTRAAIERAESPHQAMTLALASPEMQRR